MNNYLLPGIGTIEIKQGKNIKYLSIHMSPGKEIWVNVPYGVSEKQVKDFISSKIGWIEKNLGKKKNLEQNSVIPVNIGSKVKTKLHTLKLEVSLDENPSYQMKDRNIILFVPPSSPPESVEKPFKRFLLEIYKEECKELLPEWVEKLAHKNGFQYNKITFRDNTSNWGSCSYHNNISLNIRLMKLPDELIEYVILHELCHTIEKNHSDNFWALLSSVCPDYESRRRELKNYSTFI